MTQPGSDSLQSHGLPVGAAIGAAVVDMTGAAVGATVGAAVCATVGDMVVKVPLKQHVNFKIMPQPALTTPVSMRVTVTCARPVLTVTLNVSSYVSVLTQFARLTTAGHTKPVNTDGYDLVVMPVVGSLRPNPYVKHELLVVGAGSAESRAAR
jgi:hypothetical protein